MNHSDRIYVGIILNLKTLLWSTPLIGCQYLLSQMVDSSESLCAKIYYHLWRMEALVPNRTLLQRLGTACTAISTNLMDSSDLLQFDLKILAQVS